jgi:hypothetical protein
VSIVVSLGSGNRLESSMFALAVGKDVALTRLDKERSRQEQAWWDWQSRIMAISQSWSVVSSVLSILLQYLKR